MTSLADLDERDRFAGLTRVGLTPRELEAFEAQAIALSRVDPVIFSSYALGWSMQPIHVELHDLVSSHSRLVVWAPIAHGKALDIDTEIPTSSGWKRLAAIVDGDVVYGSDGHPYPVVKAHAPLLDRKVYEFRFDDGGRVVSDEDHLWKAWSHWDLAERRSPRVVSTREIVTAGVTWKKYHRWKVPVAGPVKHDEKSFTVHPYVLGCWLGDGTTGGSDITLHESDWELIERCMALEPTTRKAPRRDSRRPAVVTVGLGIFYPRGINRGNTFRNKLRDLGIFTSKRIPRDYLEGSEDQRRDLLAGLLDTDGSVCGTKGQSRVEFCTTLKILADQTTQLARSLGFKAALIGPGKQGQYRVTFTARVPVFKMARKLSRQRLDEANDGPRQRTRHRSIVDIQEVPRRTTRCLTVASPDGTFLVGRDYTVTHNTSTLTIARTIWELGRDPTIRIASISDTEGQAKKSLGVVKQLIETNPRIQAVFPKLRPERRKGHYSAWHEDAIIVERDSKFARDFSVQAIGVGGALLGARVDLAILDDILSFSNTATAGQRSKVVEWFDSTVESRDEFSMRIVVAGTGWHREDAMHVLAARPGWHKRRFDATTESLWPNVVQIGGKRMGWPKWRIEKKRETTPAFEFIRQFRCMHASAASETFNMRAIESCLDPTLPYDPEPLPSEQFYVGVDLNVKKGEARHETAFFIGRSDGTYRHVQRIIAANMNLQEIATWFMRIEAKYHPVLFLVENVAAQDYIVQLFRPETMEALMSATGATFTNGAGVHLPRVEGFATGRNKSDPILGIRGMTIEFEQKRWKIPVHADTRKWIEQLEVFDPEDHPGDVLMASWLFSNAVTRYRPRRIMSRSVTVRSR